MSGAVRGERHHLAQLTVGEFSDLETRPKLVITALRFYWYRHSVPTPSSSSLSYLRLPYGRSPVRGTE